MDSGSNTPHPRIHNGDCSLWRFIIVTEQWKRVLALHGIKRYTPSCGPEQTIKVGEVVLLEGWMGDRLKELFPRSPAMVNEWAGHIQVVPPHYLEAIDWVRVLSTVPLPQTLNRDDKLNLSGVFGYLHLPPAIRKCLYDLVADTLMQEVDMLIDLKQAPVLRQKGAALPKPERAPRKFTKKLLLHHFQDGVDATSKEFGGEWPYPDQEALDRCAALHRRVGYELDDPEKLRLPDKITEMIKKSRAAKAPSSLPPTTSNH